jgi:hypothetical protein
MKYSSFAGCFATIALVGCASPQQLTVTEPLGPGKLDEGTTGAVRVYTATETHADGDQTYYYPHTGYLVYNQEGKKVMFVPNHVGTMDEAPMTAYLPPGSYTIVAQAEGYGRVRIPLVVKSHRTTVIHLDRDWSPPKNAQTSELVRLPDGHPIGWRSD